MTESKTTEKIRCDACPVMCYIADGKAGACDRYANHGGDLIRLDPLTIIQTGDQKLVPFLGDQGDQDTWNGDIIKGDRPFITAVGAGTTYPDYKPAPFIASQKIDGIDMVTVVTEGIFSYCGVKVKIDTDRHIGHERDVVRVDGEPIGHVTTSEYGSKMLSLGGVEHLTGGTKKEGRVTCDALLKLCNREAVTMLIGEEGHETEIIVEAGQPPIINGIRENLMRVGCGSATIGMFPMQWIGHVDDVVVVDDHITGVLSEHETGKQLNVPPTGIKILGRRSTSGRYFQVAEPGLGWGGTNIDDPLKILGPFNPKIAWEGLRLLMVSTTGEQYAYYELDASLTPQPKPIPAQLKASADLIAENCEPSVCSVLFYGWRGRIASRRGDGKPRAPYAFCKISANECDLWRSRDLCLARRWDHGDGRCHGYADPVFWLCANAGSCRAYRIHPARVGLQSARGACGSHCLNRRNQTGHRA